MSEKFTSKEKEVLLQILLSLNKGNCNYTGATRVEVALSQLKELKKIGCDFNEQ